jgi:HrpA-like RNA helicase
MDEGNTIIYINIFIVHERDLDIDFCLVVIKHLLVNPEFDFKLILMSATFNIELF